MCSVNTLVVKLAPHNRKKFFEKCSCAGPASATAHAQYHSITSITASLFWDLVSADRVRVATGGHAAPGHAPGHAQRVRRGRRVRPVSVRAAHGQRAADALDRAHVRRLQGVHVLPVLRDIHRTHGPAGAHGRRSLGRDAAVRLSQARMSG